MCWHQELGIIVGEAAAFGGRQCLQRNSPVHHQQQHTSQLGRQSPSPEDASGRTTPTAHVRKDTEHFVDHIFLLNFLHLTMISVTMT